MTEPTALSPTLPSEWYTDKDLFEAERRQIFAREWLYVAHESELPGAGDYLTTSIAGFPILVVRRDGDVVAFHNVCRHRGASLLAEKAGNISAGCITCRYHGWSYDLSGRFMAAPYTDGLTASEKSRFQLHQVHTACSNGLIFVNFNDSPEGFSGRLGQLFEEINRSQFDLSRYRVHSQMTRVGAFNWKVWVEGYQECYHCSTIHPAFGRDFALEHYRVENQRLFSVHSCPRKHESASGSGDGLWLFVYPNLGLPIYETCFYTKKVNPLDVRKTQLEYTFHINEGAADETVAQFRAFIEEITDQDISVCESVQKNMDSGVFKSGVLHESRENGVIYFQSLVREAVVGSD